jgi:hypothetical protein
MHSHRLCRHKQPFKLHDELSGIHEQRFIVRNQRLVLHLSRHQTAEAEANRQLFNKRAQSYNIRFSMQ